MTIKLSDLPEGSLVEFTNGEQYEMAGRKIWESSDLADVMTKDEMGLRSDVTQVYIPYEVALQLAMWLDDVYTKTGNPESLIVEASNEVKKDK